MDIKLVIILLTLLLLAFLASRYRRSMIAPLVLAFFIAVIWTAYFRYEYSGNNFFLLNRINVYPLVLWTSGLTWLYLGTSTLRRRWRLPLGVGIYFIVLAAVEAIGYHVFNVRLASNYTSLLGLGVIHAPVLMKCFYVVAGPAYLLLMELWEFARRSSPNQSSPGGKTF